jgi:hypothetical protein
VLVFAVPEPHRSVPHPIGPPVASSNPEPMPDQQKFNAVAWFTRPIAGRQQAASTDQGVESLFAADPAAAARKWLWRLSVDERAVVDRVIVWAPRPNLAFAVYAGPVIVYRRQGAGLVEAERRDA